jgi:DNA-binding NtrC family response regulator
MESSTSFERTVKTIEIVPPSRAVSWAIEIQDDETVRRVPVGDSVLVVGTGRAANVVVRDPTVSARHCEIAATRGGLLVRDVGSRNGTYVGGARVLEAVCGEGTVITIGRTTLVCLADDEDARVASAEPLPGVAGSSVAMQKITAQVRSLASLSSPVLVTGETGVGKELIVRAIHSEGPRRERPFVALNVASLPRELVESELFGHERGAFTGAVTKRAGAFRDAQSGTLFLDEIGELPMDAQPKLLRALDGYEIRRVGATGGGSRLDARVVAATHVSLDESVAQGTFRRDLYHRLEVFVVEVPPLRERRGDVVPIARALLRSMEGELGPRELAASAVAKLAVHDWPGNVRELRNALSRAAHAAPGRWIDATAIERSIRRPSEEPNSPPSLTRRHAHALLRHYAGNVSAAARHAGVPRSTFRKVLRRNDK